MQDCTLVRVESVLTSRRSVVEFDSAGIILEKGLVFVMALVWSSLYRFRRETQTRFGRIWDLPVVKRCSRVLVGSCEADTRILEIGAGDRRLQQRLNDRLGRIDYKSMDIDTQLPHDFYSLQEIRGTYDVVCMFEVIEHLSLSDARAILQKAYEHLIPGGTLALSTPNTYYPPAFLRDATHVTPWCYDELGGMVKLAGFEVTQIYRVYHQSLFKKLLRRYLAYPLYRLIGIDFAPQILMLGRKPTSR